MKQIKMHPKLSKLAAVSLCLLLALQGTTGGGDRPRQYAEIQSTAQALSLSTAAAAEIGSAAAPQGRVTVEVPRSGGVVERRAETLPQEFGYNAYRWDDNYPDALLQDMIAGMAHNTTVNVEKYGIQLSEVAHVMDAVDRAYPMECVASGVNGYSTSYYVESQQAVSISFIYFDSMDSADYDSRIAKVHSVADTVVAKAQNMTDFDKIIYIHDELSRCYHYDWSYERHAAYELLADQAGVCQAYATLYKMYMDLFRIPCQVVLSTAMDHSWNLVYLNGNWYHVDVTWDDASSDGVWSYTYMLLNDSEMLAKDHDNWEAGYTSASTAYSNMPRGNNDVQIEYQGHWYLYNSASSNIQSCTANGSSKNTIVSNVTGGFAIYNGVLFYGAGDTLRAYWIDSGHSGKIYTLTDSEKNKTGNASDTCITNVAVTANGRLFYRYRIVTNTASSTVWDGQDTIDLTQWIDPLRTMYQALDKLSATVSTEAQAEQAKKVLAQYDSLSALQKDNIDSARLNKLNALRSALAAYQGVAGDLNGDGKINGKDATLLMQYLASWDVSVNTKTADVNHDGTIDGKDATLLVQYLAGWDVTLG